MFRRCAQADQRRDAAEEHRANSMCDACGMATGGYGALHIAHQPMDCEVLHHYVHRSDKRLLSLHAAYLRLPPVPRRNEHKAGHGDTRGSRAAGVRKHVHTAQERRDTRVHARQLPRLYLGVRRHQDGADQEGLRTAYTRLRHYDERHWRRHHRAGAHEEGLHLPARFAPTCRG